MMSAWTNDDNRVDSDEIDPKKLEQLKEKLWKWPPIHEHVAVESEQFRQFIFDLTNPKIREDKKIYDVCLTCWQYLTAYKLRLHQMLGHEGIKGNYIRNQEDFMVLAKAYGRLFNNEKGVTLIAAYSKPVRTRNISKDDSNKKIKKDIKLVRKSNETAGLALPDIMNCLNYTNEGASSLSSHSKAQFLMNLMGNPLGNTAVLKPHTSEIGSLSSDQEKILFTTQWVSMAQMINTNLTNFRIDMSKRLEELLNQFGIKGITVSCKEKKTKKSSNEKENMVPSKLDDIKRFPIISGCKDSKSQKKNYLIENLKNFK